MRFGVQVGRGGLESSASVNVEWVGGGSDLAELVWELWDKPTIKMAAWSMLLDSRMLCASTRCGSQSVSMWLHNARHPDEQYRQQELSHATIPFWLAAFARVATMSATRHL